VTPRPATPTGTLGLSTRPYFSRAFVDGEAVGSTPLPSLVLPAGAHTVVLEGSKGGRAEVAVTVVAGEKQVVCWDWDVGAACRR
jgi:hypothetical protein